MLVKCNCPNGDNTFSLVSLAIKGIATLFSRWLKQFEVHVLVDRCHTLEDSRVTEPVLWAWCVCGGGGVLLPDSLADV